MQTDEQIEALVEQVDRDAAADYMGFVSALKGKYDPVSMAFMDPACDDLPIVQALARHRLASTAELQAENMRLRGVQSELEELLDAADYYIDRLGRIIAKVAVRDLEEAQSGYFTRLERWDQKHPVNAARAILAST